MEMAGSAVFTTVLSMKTTSVPSDITMSTIQRRQVGPPVVAGGLPAPAGGDLYIDSSDGFEQLAEWRLLDGQLRERLATADRLIEALRKQASELSTELDSLR